MDRRVYHGYSVTRSYGYVKSHQQYPTPEPSIAHSWYYSLGKNIYIDDHTFLTEFGPRFHPLFHSLSTIQQRNLLIETLRRG